MFSSWAIYNTACLLADGLFSMNNNKQTQFRATLFQYLWIISITAVISGSIIHYYLTRKVTRPLKDLIRFTKNMKQGVYSSPAPLKIKGEIGELATHFHDLAQQLESDDCHRRKLVSDLSHEFRTPLTNLNGYLRALQSGDMQGDVRLFQSLYAESTKLIQLVEHMEQLKEWDHITTRTFEKKETVNMEEFIRTSVEIFQRSSEQKDIELKMNIQSGIVLLNRTSISQVISNLMDNAIRYYEGTEPIRIIGENIRNGYSVSITGPGRMMKPSDIEKLFERFYRTEHSRSRELGGSGLGLAISKEIIERHYGTIAVESDGSMHTFWFTLPSDGAKI